MEIKLKDLNDDLILNRSGETIGVFDALKNSSTLTNVTYNELVTLRNSSGLTPGNLYRITDYNTYVSNIIDYAQSDGHAFDVIVVALKNNVLSENALAIQHSGDTYFANSDLSSWELKYCIDNDTDRFNWASLPHGEGVVIRSFYGNLLEKTNQTIEVEGNTYYIFGTKAQVQAYCGENDAYFCFNTNTPSIDTECQIAYFGEDDEYHLLEEVQEWQYVCNIVNSSSSAGTGVIYWMKDEFNNECPYDFKNIQFKRYKVTGTTQSNLTSLINTYVGFTNITNSDSEEEFYYFDIDSSQSVWRYTFDKNNLNSNLSAVDASISGYTKNVYKNKIESYINGKLVLNNIVFNGINNYNNIFKTNCFSNTFGNNCDSNTFGNCNSNTFGNNCYYNTFGNNCYFNAFGNNCGYNTFGNICDSNTFGNNCYNNIFGNSCNSNTFGNYCGYNTFGNGYGYNTFGNSCYYNTFGNYCESNTFGNYSSNNTFGNNCNNITFGNYCDSNTFGNSCDLIMFNKDYCKFIIVENGNKNITITSTQTTSSSNVLRNITIAQGVNNTWDEQSVVTISHNTVNDTFQTRYVGSGSADVVVTPSNINNNNTDGDDEDVEDDNNVVNDEPGNGGIPSGDNEDSGENNGNEQPEDGEVIEEPNGEEVLDDPNNGEILTP